MSRARSELIARVVTLMLFLPVCALFDGCSAGSPQWEPINNGLKNLHVKSIAVNPSDSDTLYAGTDTGVYKSTNGGNIWFGWGLDTMKVGDIILFPPEPGILIIGTENGGVWLSRRNDSTWFPMNIGLPIKRVPRLAISQERELVCGPNAHLIYRWHWDKNYWVPAGGGREAHGFSFSDSQIGYAATSKGLWRTDTGGFGWYKLSTGNLQSFSAVAVSQTNPLLVYACPDSGGVYKSENGGMTWQVASTGLPRGVTVTSLLRGIDGALFAGTGGYGVYKSTDGANYWAPFNEGLDNPVICLGALVVDTDNRYLYVGTDGGGIFRRKLR